MSDSATKPAPYPEDSEILAAEFPEIAAERAAWRRPGGDPRLYADLREQTRILSLLYDVAHELTAILDMEELLRAIGQRVRQLVPFDLFSVLLLNEETQRLEHSFSLRYDTRIYLRKTLALGEGLCGTAAQQRRAVRVRSVASDPRYVRCESGLAVQSELVVPLLRKDRVLGVLDFESLEQNSFTEQHQHLLETLASSVAIAIENARLYAQVKAAERRKAEDLEHAREVQQALLPKRAPQVRGVQIAVRYTPARELGGDFYDFLPYGPDGLAIAVGDVAGKGSAAALYGTLGVGMLREHAAHHQCPPEEMLEHLNERLHAPGGESQFIALAFGAYRAATRELVLANAGFPRPLLVRQGKATAIEVAGIPVGMLPGARYDAARLTLQPGDVLVFCSDGVHEQTNRLGEEFGLGRLLDRLATAREGCSAESIAEDIRRAVEEYAPERAGCDECSDDRTIVVLRVQEE